MKLSKLFTKTLRSAPADEVSKNAQLLIRAGYIYKEMAGVYAYLPLGRLVLDKIINIIREEMDAIGGNEISLTALQPKETWEKSGRWSDDVMDVWFKTELNAGGTVGLAPTHEEPLTQMMRSYISSYRDLPVYPYQFQIKFRNELRSKSGLMRGREFWMKDLYSFSKDKKEHDEFYKKITQSYLNIFERLGLGDVTYKTFASGGSFSKYSHEFQAVSPVGEDTIYLDKKEKLAINKEVYSLDIVDELDLDENNLEEVTAVEVGNIFTLGTKYSEPLNLTYTDEDGKEQPVFMGSYGIGPSRLMGVIAEHFADDKGLVWPENIAPFKVYLAQIGEKSKKVADEAYESLKRSGVEVLYDDRDERAGAKFADSELLGIPYRLTISDRSMEAGKYEWTERRSGKVEVLTLVEVIDRIT